MALSAIAHTAIRKSSQHSFCATAIVLASTSAEVLYPRPLTGCPVAVRRCRRRPATCVPGTRPAPRFKSGGVASNGRLLTRPVALPRAARLGSRARKTAGTEREHRTVQAAHPDHAHAHAHTHNAAAARTYTTQGGWVGGWASRWVIARSPRPPPQRTRPRSTNELHSPRAAAARHTPPSHTDTPTTPTHTHTTQPPHAHARRRAGRWVCLAVGGVRALRPCGFVQNRTFNSRSGGDGGGGDAQRRMGRARALDGQAGGTAACAARRVRARRGRAAWWASFAGLGGHRARGRAAGRSGRRGASDGRLMRLPRA